MVTIEGRKIKCFVKERLSRIQTPGNPIECKDSVVLLVKSLSTLSSSLYHAHKAPHLQRNMFSTCSKASMLCTTLRHCVGGF